MRSRTPRTNYVLDFPLVSLTIVVVSLAKSLVVLQSALNVLLDQIGFDLTEGLRQRRLQLVRRNPIWKVRASLVLVLAVVHDLLRLHVQHDSDDRIDFPLQVVIVELVEL